MIELRDVQRGGPFGTWGARLYWRGVLVHVLRSYGSEAYLHRCAHDWAKQMCVDRDLADGSRQTPDRLRAWAVQYGSLRADCGGEAVYAAA